MRAILLENFGAAESLNVREVPTPAPGNGEVLVEIRAAATNPSDVKNVEGKTHGTTLPRVPRGNSFLPQRSQRNAEEFQLYYSPTLD